MKLIYLIILFFELADLEQFEELHLHIQKLEERLEIQQNELQNVEMEKAQVEENFENSKEELKYLQFELEQEKEASHSKSKSPKNCIFTKKKLN